MKRTLNIHYQWDLELKSAKGSQNVRSGTSRLVWYATNWFIGKITNQLAVLYTEYRDIYMVKH